jgi:hypothetical protein
MPNANRPAHALPQCSVCGVSFPTTQEKEAHLRLHCVLCKVLYESRDKLLDHMKDSHPAEGGAVFWPREELKANSPAEDEDWVEHELDPGGSPTPHED